MPDIPTFYPPINSEQSLSVINRLYEANPEFFDAPTCPYSDFIKSLFKGTAKVHDMQTHRKPASRPTTGNDLEDRIAVLSEELEAYGDFIHSSAEVTPADRNTYFRLSVTLLEKLIDLKKDTIRINQYLAFQQVILNFMDRNLTPDQRTELMQKITDLIGQEEAKPEENTTESTNSGE